MVDELMTRSEGSGAIILRRNGLTVTALRRVPPEIEAELVALVAKVCMRRIEQ